MEPIINRKIPYLPLAFIIFFYIATAISGSNTTCYFSNIYGIPCPGCGLTRAYIHLLKFDISGAFYFHPLFILPALIFLILLFKDKGIIKAIYENKLFWIIVISVFILTWVVRMIVLFPSADPMRYNNSALIPTLFRYLTGK